MLQLLCLILTFACMLCLVVILTRNFQRLSESERAGKTTFDFKLLKVFEIHLHYEKSDRGV